MQVKDRYRGLYTRHTEQLHSDENNTVHDSTPIPHNFYQLLITSTRSPAPSSLRLQPGTLLHPITWSVTSPLLSDPAALHKQPRAIQSTKPHIHLDLMLYLLTTQLYMLSVLAKFV